MWGAVSGADKMPTSRAWAIPKSITGGRPGQQDVDGLDVGERQYDGVDGAQCSDGLKGWVLQVPAEARTVLADRPGQSWALDAFGGDPGRFVPWSASTIAFVQVRIQ